MTWRPFFFRFVSWELSLAQIDQIGSVYSVSCVGCTLSIVSTRECRSLLEEGGGDDSVNLGEIQVRLW